MLRIDPSSSRDRKKKQQRWKNAFLSFGSSEDSRTQPAAARKKTAEKMLQFAEKLSENRNGENLSRRWENRETEKPRTERHPSEVNFGYKCILVQFFIEKAQRCFSNLKAAWKGMSKTAIEADFAFEPMFGFMLCKSWIYYYSGLVDFHTVSLSLFLFITKGKGERVELSRYLSERLLFLYVRLTALLAGALGLIRRTK